MKNYNEMTELEYCDTIREYASLYGSMPEFNDCDAVAILDDFKQGIASGSDEFIASLTEEQLADFAHSVAREMSRTA